MGGVGGHFGEDWIQAIGTFVRGQVVFYKSQSQLSLLKYCSSLWQV